jgi:hypothetical protein
VTVAQRRGPGRGPSGIRDPRPGGVAVGRLRCPQR